MFEFSSSLHEARFNNLVLLYELPDIPENRHVLSLLYILSGNKELFNIARDIFDIEDLSIYYIEYDSGFFDKISYEFPDFVNVSESSEALLALGYNLYKNICVFGRDTNPNYIFSRLNENDFIVALNALKIHFGRA